MLFASCTVSRGKDTADERAGLENELYKASYKIWFETLEDADAGTFIGGNDKWQVENGRFFYPDSKLTKN